MICQTCFTEEALPGEEACTFCLGAEQSDAVKEDA